MIDRSAKVTRLKEVDRVEVGDIQTPTVGSGTIGRIFLNMETKETDVSTILLLEGEDGSRLVGEAALHQTFVHMDMSLAIHQGRGCISISRHL